MNFGAAGQTMLAAQLAIVVRTVVNSYGCCAVTSVRRVSESR
jgi:hypothetical protein